MLNESNTPPSMDHYYMGIAIAVRERANCQGTRVGALVVKGNRIVSTGYNGTPSGMVNCLDGGCRRCAARDFPSGSGYDLCICVHAEQNALLAAARFGISVGGSTLYTTSRPCFGCTKEIIQAKVAEVVYLHEWAHPDERWQEEYNLLQGEIQLRRYAMKDPQREWAIRRGGHNVLFEQE